VASPRWCSTLPLLTFGAALALYATTMAHQHGGDTPGYLEDVRRGLYFHPSHVLPRWLVGWGVGLAHRLSPTLSPYTPAVAIAGTFAGASAAALTHQLLRRLTGGELVPLVCAATLGTTAVYWIEATTFEVHLLPVVVLLLTAMAAAEIGRSPHPVRRALVVGLLQGLATGFHVLASGAAFAWCAVVLLDARPLRPRLAMLGAVVGGAASVVVSLYGGMSWLRASTGPPPPDDRLLTLLILPTDAGAHAIYRDAAAPWMDAVHGIQDAVGAGAGQHHGLAAAAGALVVVCSLPWMRGPWQRVRGLAVVPVAWALGTMPLILWVQPSNMEYYAGPVTALALHLGLVLDEALRRSARPTLAHGGIAAVGLGLTAALAHLNWPTIERLLTSPTGDHVGVERVDGGAPQLRDGWGRPVDADQPRSRKGRASSQGRTGPR